jgi:hypothetical protein
MDDRRGPVLIDLSLSSVPARTAGWLVVVPARKQDEANGLSVVKRACRFIGEVVRAASCRWIHIRRIPAVPPDPAIVF